MRTYHSFYEMRHDIFLSDKSVEVIMNDDKEFEHLIDDDFIDQDYGFEIVCTVMGIVVAMITLHFCG